MWEVGKSYEITWSFLGSSSQLVQIELGIPGSDGSVIATNVQGSLQKYVWTIPSTVALRSDYKVIIREPSPSYTLLDSSDNYFNINSGTVGIQQDLEDIEDQLASVGSAVSQLLEMMKEFIK